MWPFPVATLLFLHLARLGSAKCPPTRLSKKMDSSGVLEWENWNTTACVNVGGQNITEIRGSFLPGGNVKQLDLSGNRLAGLPPGFLRQAGALEMLFLQHNRLENLSAELFETTPKLRVLALQGNRLRAVPATVFRPALETLRVDCQCDLLGSLLQFNTTASIECQDPSSRNFASVATSYERQCKAGDAASPPYAAIVVPILALLLAAGLAYFLVRRRRTQAAVSQDKRVSSASDGVQPRYITHAGLQGELAADGGVHPSYENVCIQQPEEPRGGNAGRGGRKPSRGRSPPAGEEADGPPGEQPIYANTEGVYCNYSAAPVPTTPEDDIYIMPDH